MNCEAEFSRFFAEAIEPADPGPTEAVVATALLLGILLVVTLIDALGQWLRQRLR